MNRMGGRRPVVIGEDPCERAESLTLLPFIGRTPPAGLRPDQIPQLVVITMDDSVNGRTMPDYMRLFEETRWRFDSSEI